MYTLREIFPNGEVRVPRKDRNEICMCLSSQKPDAPLVTGTRDKMTRLAEWLESRRVYFRENGINIVSTVEIIEVPNEQDSPQGTLQATE